MACMLSITTVSILETHHAQFLTMLLEDDWEAPRTTMKVPRGSRFTGWEPLPQSIYYIRDQGHNLKNFIFPMVITRNTAINHLHAHIHKRNTEFHSAVLSAGNENSREWVTGCGPPSVYGTSEPKGFFCWLCDRGLAKEVGTENPDRGFLF